MYKAESQPLREWPGSEELAILRPDFEKGAGLFRRIRWLRGAGFIARGSLELLVNVGGK